VGGVDCRKRWEAECDWGGRVGLMGLGSVEPRRRHLALCRWLRRREQPKHEGGAHGGAVRAAQPERHEARQLEGGVGERAWLGLGLDWGWGWGWGWG
jgi:hypothetical protein